MRTRRYGATLTLDRVRLRLAGALRSAARGAPRDPRFGAADREPCRFGLQPLTAAHGFRERLARAPAASSARASSISSARSAVSARISTWSRATCKNPPPTAIASSLAARLTRTAPGSSVVSSGAWRGRIPTHAFGARRHDHVDGVFGEHLAFRGHDLHS